VLVIECSVETAKTVTDTAACFYAFAQVIISGCLGPLSDRTQHATHARNNVSNSNKCLRWPFLGDSMLSDRCLSCLTVTLVYCGQTLGWIKIPLGTEVGLIPGHIVLDGDPASPTERGTAAPGFSANVYCDYTVAQLSNCRALVRFLRCLRCVLCVWLETAPIVIGGRC